MNRASTCIGLGRAKVPGLGNPRNLYVSTVTITDSISFSSLIIDIDSEATKGVGYINWVWLTA